MLYGFAIKRNSHSAENETPDRYFLGENQLVERILKFKPQSYESDVGSKVSFDTIAQKHRPCDVRIWCREHVHIAHPLFHNVDAKILLGVMVVIIAKPQG